MRALSDLERKLMSENRTLRAENVSLKGQVQALKAEQAAVKAEITNAFPPVNTGSIEQRMAARDLYKARIDNLRTWLTANYPTLIDGGADLLNHLFKYDPTSIILAGCEGVQQANAHSLYKALNAFLENYWMSRETETDS